MKNCFLTLFSLTALSALLSLLPDNLYATEADSTLPPVQTKQGLLVGVKKDGICVWRGVRYAKPPVGNFRFRALQPLESWKGRKDATSFGPVAPQITKVVREKQKQSEDCLFLNIWSPAADDKKRPVMFWIHGGGFMTGSGSSPMYDGEQLARKGDVVVVSINYRLGPLGFLYFKDLPANSGFDNNLGMQDQVAALQWVKENITAFGGDPSAVTIFGESAGAISVLTLMEMPSAKGLFKRAIAESPAPEALWTAKVATSVTKRYLQILGISPDSLNRLKSVPVDSLNNAMEKLMKEWIGQASLTKTFSPTVDGDLIPEDIMKAVGENKNTDVALLIGTNENEANLFALKRLKMAPVNGEQLTPYLSKLSPTDKERLTGSYKDYPHKDGVLAIITDGVFRMPSIKFADLHSAYAPTYMYRFDWASLPLRVYGLKACHALELPFVFGTLNSGLGKKLHIMTSKKNIYRLSDRMQQAWLNFAKSGSPDLSGQNDWKPYDTSSRATLIFNNRIQELNDPESKLRQVWSGLTIF